MRKFLIASFEHNFQYLLLSVNEYLAKREFKNNVTSRLFKFEDSLLYEKKTVRKEIEIAKQIAIITLEQYLNIPLIFVDEWCRINNPHKYFREDVIANFFNKNSIDTKTHILFFLSLINEKAVEEVKQLLNLLYDKREALRLNIPIDFVAIPSVVANEGHIESHIDTIKQNTYNLLEVLQNHSEMTHLYFVQNTNEDGTPLILSNDFLTKICGNFVISLIQGYNFIAEQETQGKIGVFTTESIEVNKFNLINSWLADILKNNISPFFIRKQKDSERNKFIKHLAKKLLIEMKQSRPDLKMDSDMLKENLNKWSNSIKNTIQQIVKDNHLSSEDLQDLLSLVRLSYNVNSETLIELDDNRIRLLEDFYMEYLTTEILEENPFESVKEVLSHIHEQIKLINKQNEKVELLKNFYNPNEPSNGEWINETTIKIGDNEYRTYDLQELVLNENETKGQYVPKPEKLENITRADLHKYFSKIKNQGHQGSCASFSLVSIAEYYLGNQKDLSEAYVYYNARKRQGTCNEDVGATLEDVVSSMRNDGICLEELCPYDEKIYNKEPSEEAYNDGKERKTEGALTVSIDINHIKSAILEGHPVVACFRIFDSLKNNTSGYVPMPSDTDFEEREKYHAMVICGFNDQSKYFIVRNSWGIKFGDDGYCYIPYAYFRDKRLVFDAMIIRGIETSQVLPIPDTNNIRNKEDDPNVRYIVSNNVLEEEILELNSHKKNLIVLLNKCKETIETLDFERLIADRTDTIRNKHRIYEEKIADLTNRLTNLSFSMYKIVNACFGISDIMFFCIAVFCAMDESNYSYAIGSAALTTLITIAWLLTLHLKKKKEKKAILNEIKEITTQLNLIDENLIKFKKFCCNLKLLLDAIKGLDDFSYRKFSDIRDTIDYWEKLLEELQKIPSNTLNVFPPDYPKFDFIDYINKFLTNPASKSAYSILYDLQTKLLENLYKNFNIRIEDVIKGDLWEDFKNRIVQCKLLAKFNYDSSNSSIDIPTFYSNRKNQDLPIKCNYSSLDNNMYVYTYIKYINPDLLTLFH